MKFEEVFPAFKEGKLISKLANYTRNNVRIRAYYKLALYEKENELKWSIHHFMDGGEKDIQLINAVTGPATAMFLEDLLEDNWEIHNDIKTYVEILINERVQRVIEYYESN